jgi:hypothetical protein
VGLLDVIYQLALQLGVGHACLLFSSGGSEPLAQGPVSYLTCTRL